MSCIQFTPCVVRHSTSVSTSSLSSRLPSKPCLIPVRYKRPVWALLRMAANASKNSKCSPVVKKYRAPVCLFAGGGMPDNNSTEGSQSKPIEKAPEKKSIEEILWEQIEKKEYAAEPSVSAGGKPPGGREGGRDRGRGWGDGDSEGKDMSEEALQVTLATIGFVLVYLSTIHGEDVILLARDYIRFLSTGNRTVRLRKVMEWFSQRRPGSQKRMAVHGIDEDEDNDEDEYAFQ